MEAQAGREVPSWKLALKEGATEETLDAAGDGPQACIRWHVEHPAA